MDFSTQLDDSQQRATDAKTAAQAAGSDGPGREGPRTMPGRRSLLRTGFGVLLFVAWGILTILWVASTVYSVANGNVAAAVTAVAAVALLVLLGLMEGLEVSVIDRWQTLWPGRPPSYLSDWLAVRQLFVALIVTAATLLANRSVIVIPGTSVQITHRFILNVFDLAWTTLTVLWFAQILPKHFGAMNPDRYLWLLQRPLFPIVHFVHLIGVSQPGEWTAVVVEDRLAWSLSPDELKRQRPEHELSHASIWRELGAHHHRKPRTRRAGVAMHRTLGPAGRQSPRSNASNTPDGKSPESGDRRSPRRPL